MSFLKLLSFIGPGFIAALSGLEITNIGTFSYIGSVYGFKLLWVVVLSLAITTFLQQICTIIAVEFRKGIIELFYGTVVAVVFVILIFLSNILTLAINLFSFAIIIHELSGINFDNLFISLALIIYALCLRREYKRIEGVLTILALLLGVYILLFCKIVSNDFNILINVIKHVILPKGNIFEDNVLLDVLAILGAAAAPYTLIYQTYIIKNRITYIRRIIDEFIDIILGLIFTSIISIIIVIVAFNHSHGPIYSISDLLALVRSDSLYTELFYILGLCSTILLAIIAIIVCNACLVYELFNFKVKNITGTGIYKLTALITLGLSILIVYTYINITHLSLTECFVNIVRDFSIYISISSSILYLIIPMIYNKTQVFYSPIIGTLLVLISVILIVINIMGVSTIINI